MALSQNNPEYKVQTACIKYFRLKYPKYIIASIPNEGCWKSKQYFTNLGMLTGISDTIIITDKEVVFCEFKAGKNRQSLEQKTFQQQVEQLGYKYWLVYNLDEFIKLTDTL